MINYTSNRKALIIGLVKVRYLTHMKVRYLTLSGNSKNEIKFFILDLSSYARKCNLKNPIGFDKLQFAK